jgi:hypothetical protein
MFTHEEFAAEVARHFEFLETDYGMRRESPQKAAGRSWIGFANVNVRVIVEHEENAYVSVTVQNLRHIKHDPLDRSEFDLDEIVAASPRPPRRQELRANRESVAKAADILRSFGAQALSGDFATLHARQQKAVETLRKYDAPPLPNNEPEQGRKR